MQTEDKLGSTSIVNLSVSELGDVLKSKKNLIYLFALNGKINRVFFATRKNVYTGLSKTSDEWFKEIDENEPGKRDPKSSSYQRNQFRRNLERY